MMQSFIPTGDFDRDSKYNETTWSRNHALVWATKEGLLAQEAEEFAEYFMNGWMIHLEENSGRVAREMQKIYEIFQEGGRSGE
jgi:hypothetical protein